ncbi:hypothetical protein [Gordonia rubripertincta]|uniref:GIY-YIG domain-containing protein n=1 Tax=Gordonia rubripertincta TaxID=36822 RepID=A0ABT4MYZ3_GORRU|nr:hypothetical protein [Gordonia rubripertincta]MCZ4552224.1 hypothetical protein [Gordonia rubripertincta]
MPPTPNRLLPDWKTRTDISKWADARKFGPATAMNDANLRALSRAYGTKPTGLYIWESESHEVYIGISEVSVVKRLRSHLIDFGLANIQSFRYLEYRGDRNALRSIERQFIYEAIWDGFTVFNSEHSSAIFGESVFDDTLNADEQVAWFEDPSYINLKAKREPHQINSSELARSQKRYAIFERRPDRDRIIDAISLYLRACTPYPFQTQLHFWGVSCLPSTNLGRGYKRLSTVNMGMLEMLWINETPDGVNVRLGVDYRFLPPKKTEKTLKRLGVTMFGMTHQNGGANEEVLGFESLQDFHDAMHSSQHIRVAAARFALDRMRKGRLSGRYRDAHNYLLADLALDRIGTWNVESKPLDSLSKLRTE